MAPSFITKFFKHFPSLHEAATDAILDLIEDEDPQVIHEWSVYFFARVVHLSEMLLSMLRASANYISCSFVDSKDCN